MTDCSKRAPRQKVLIIPGDGDHLEVFGDKNIDVLIARRPVAPTRDAEPLADDVLYLSLPRQYRDLYRDDRLRAVGTTRPLLPSVARAATVARDQLHTLTQLANEGEEEVVAWAI